MRTDHQQALKMRLGGKSYTEISRFLKIPKSTLSGWFSNLAISKESRDAIERRGRKKAIEGLIRRNKNQTTLARRRATETREAAAKEVKKLSENDIFVLGVSLYWAEGYKRAVVRNGREITSHPVSLTNSDPSLVKGFLRFLREYCKVPNKKIKAGLRIFKHQNEQELLRFWQHTTGIIKENFNKTYLGISKSSQGIRPYNRLPYGVIQIVVADTALFHRIIGYIEGIKALV